MFENVDPASLVQAYSSFWQVSPDDRTLQGYAMPVAVAFEILLAPRPTDIAPSEAYACIRGTMEAICAKLVVTPSILTAVRHFAQTFHAMLPDDARLPGNLAPSAAWLIVEACRFTMKGQQNNARMCMACAEWVQEYKIQISFEGDCWVYTTPAGLTHAIFATGVHNMNAVLRLWVQIFSRDSRAKLVEVFGEPAVESLKGIYRHAAQKQF